MSNRKKIRRQPPTKRDRPITDEGADLLARRHGYRLLGFDPRTRPAAFGAVFAPEPDDGGPVLVGVGLTRTQALWTGIDTCRESPSTRARSAAAAEEGQPPTAPEAPPDTDPGRHRSPPRGPPL